MAELFIREKLNKALIEKGIITKANLKKALETQKTRGGKLSDILVELGFVDKKLLMSLLSTELGIPPIDLSRYKIDPHVIKLIPKKIAKHYQIVPISKIGKLLTIAMADPLNVLATDDVKTLTGLKIGVVVATDKDKKTSAFLEGGCVDTDFLNRAGVTIVYNRGTCSNPDLTEVRENVYLLTGE